MKHLLLVAVCLSVAACRDWDLTDLADAGVDAGPLGGGSATGGGSGGGAAMGGGTAMDAGTADAGWCGGAWCLASSFVTGSADVGRGVWALRPDLAFVGVYGPRYFVFDGASWSMVDAPSGIGGNYVSTVWGFSENDILMGTDTGDSALLGTTTSLGGDPASRLSAIRGLADGGSIYSVGGSVIRQLINGAWAACTSDVPTSVTLRALAVVAEGDVWVAGTGGTIAHATDGVTFTSYADAGLVDDFYTGFAFAPNDVWFAGAGGVLVHWDGTTLTRRSCVSCGDLWSMWGLSSNDFWVMSATGKVSHFVDGGSLGSGGITPPANDFGRGVGGLWGAGPNDLFISNNGPDGGGVFHYRR